MTALFAIGGLLCGIPVGFIAGIIWMGWVDNYTRDTEDLDYSGGL